ncbi:hypothetical protein [Streptomyces aquilus]
MTTLAERVDGVLGVATHRGLGAGLVAFLDQAGVVPARRFDRVRDGR